MLYPYVISQQEKQNYKKRDYIKVKKFLQRSKPMTKQGHLLNGRRYLQSIHNINGLKFKMHKELIWLNIKRKKIKTGRRPKETFFFQRRHTDIKRWKLLILLISREMQISTIMSYHFTPISVIIIKDNNKKYWQWCRKKETLVHWW